MGLIEYKSLDTVKHSAGSNGLSIRWLYPWMLFSVISISCHPSYEILPLSDHELAKKWCDMTLHITQFTPANSPTFASRAIGYIGLAMYESVAHGSESHQSIGEQLNGLEDLPMPQPGQEYNWHIAYNAASSNILSLIYQQTSDENKSRIDSLESTIYTALSNHINDPSIIDRSVQFGRDIAQTIYDWSLTDGGHRGYLNNFDREFVHPEHPGSWKPPLYAQSFSHHPLHPYWGKNRTFLKENGHLDDPFMIEYDPAPGSDYYDQFRAVYEKDRELTQEEKEIAIWWGDDPDDTFTPPGHSFYLASLLIDRYEVDLFKAAETYARVGLSVADAFINCWKWKYHFFSERPNTFIPQHMDEQWESFWPDPPFPAFPSGHAIQAAAAACALMDLYDNNTSFIDRSHEGRERDELRDVDFKYRSFDNIWAVAIETADSRFYGGIHVPQDNEVGLTEGVRIAENVNRLGWRNDEE
jgi:hypothetical protein